MDDLMPNDRIEYVPVATDDVWHAIQTAGNHATWRLKEIDSSSGNYRCCFPNIRRGDLIHSVPKESSD